MGAFDVNEAITSYQNFISDSDEESYKAAGEAGRIRMLDVVGIKGPPLNKKKMKVL